MRGCRGCPPDKLAAFQSAYSNRLMNVWMIAIGLFPAVAGIRALMSGLDTWWLWLLAAAAQLASLLVRRNVGRKLGVVRVRPDAQTSRRQHRQSRVCMARSRSRRPQRTTRTVTWERSPSSWWSRRWQGSWLLAGRPSGCTKTERQTRNRRLRGDRHRHQYSRIPSSHRRCVCRASLIRTGIHTVATSLIVKSSWRGLADATGAWHVFIDGREALAVH